jgi:hypothetical protein
MYKLICLSRLGQACRQAGKEKRWMSAEANQDGRLIRMQS